MRCVGADISKVGLFGITLLLDPAKRRFKKYVCAKSLSLHDRVVMTNHRIEIASFFIGIGREICLTSGEVLTDSAGSMDQNFTKTAARRLIGFFVAKMPLAKDTCFVPGCV